VVDPTLGGSASGADTDSESGSKSQGAKDLPAPGGAGKAQGGESSEQEAGGKGAGGAAEGGQAVGGGLMRRRQRRPRGPRHKWIRSRAQAKGGASQVCLWAPGWQPLSPFSVHRVVCCTAPHVIKLYCACTVVYFTVLLLHHQYRTVLYC